MKDNDIEVEIRETVHSADIVSVKIIYLMKLIVKIRSKIENSNLYELFQLLYLSDEHHTFDEVAEITGMDCKTLRRKRSLFCKLYLETKREILNEQEVFLNSLF